MDKSKLAIIGALTIVAIVLIIVLWIVAIIGGMDLTDGCLYRYSFNSDGSVSSSDSYLNTATLKASGNYTATTADSGNGFVLDPNAYGKWLNTNVRLTSGQRVDLVIKGEVSLCKSYIPSYNLQSVSNLDSSGSVIEIPRVEDGATAPATLVFNARTGEWRNVLQVFNNDKVLVTLEKDKKTTSATTSVYSSISKANLTADCTEGKRAYDPICGRYAIADSSITYVDRCRYVEQCYECNCRDECDSWNLFGWCIGGWSRVCDWCSCYENVNGTAPEPYRNDGKYTSPWSDNLSNLFTNFARDCRTEHSYVDGDYQNEKYFWFSADTATGLLYRFDSSLNPSSKASRGSGYNFSSIQTDQTALNGDQNKQIILQGVLSQGDVKYLQYRFHDSDGNFGDNTGGYVLGVKHTKCRRENGNAYNDTIQGRGVVQYVIADYGQNPNTSMTSLTANNIVVNQNGSGSITSNTQGYIWIKINNAPGDYQDSFGQYEVQFFTQVGKKNFYTEVLGPFFEGFKSKIKGASITIYKNMTCYHGLGDSQNCTNFFNYIKAILSLYIMIYGMMFLMGMVKISQTDLVIRIAKISFVAGLMNDSTFDFFNNYVFDFVTEFSDTIIANMSGYSMFSGSTTVSNPLMFMNEVMTKIFLSSTFAAQIMALLSMGINGVIYFIIIIVCLGIILIVLFRAIAVYLMAYMAISVLIGISPLFLTFILFEKTRYLFDNWVKFTFRYMVEPIIMLAGIIILTQLFTIYLDNVIGYSVCWKCAIPIKIPFPNIEGISPAFLDVEIFCFNWFAPWGFDHRSNQMGLNMQNVVVLLMLAYCMWGYMDFSASIVGRLAGGAGGPSATGMGKGMAGAAEDAMLKKVGLDSESREAMKEGAKERLSSMRKGDKKAPLSKGDRHDVGDPKDSKEGSSSSPSSSSSSSSPSTNKESSATDEKGLKATGQGNPDDKRKASQWKKTSPSETGKKAEVQVGASRAAMNKVDQLGKGRVEEMRGERDREQRKDSAEGSQGSTQFGSTLTNPSQGKMEKPRKNEDALRDDNLSVDSGKQESGERDKVERRKIEPDQLDREKQDKEKDEE